jgi:hypothetical protein
MSGLDRTAIAGKYTQLRTALNEHVKAAQEELNAEALKTVHAVGAAFFALHPEVHAIRWTQYTPEWQDGENCYFGVNEISLQFSSPSKAAEAEDEGDDDYDEDGEYFEGHEDLLHKREHQLREIAEIEADLAEGETEAKKRDYWRRVRSPEDIDKCKAEIAAIDARIEQAGGLETYSLIVADFKIASEILGSIHDDEMEVAFGDDALVLLTKDGVEVREISHN